MPQFITDAIEYMRDFIGPVKSTIGITIILCIVFIILGALAKKVKPDSKTPLFLTPVFMFVEMMNKSAKQNFGKNWRFYSPYFIALPIYIFVSNSCDLLGLSNPTSYLVNTIALGFMSFVLIQVTSIISNGPWQYIKDFFSPNPILFPINFIGEISFPFSLGLRLFGNILSSVVLSTIIVSMLKYWSIPFLPIIGVIFSICFGLIQTLVFTLLTIIFTSNKINEKDLIF